MKRVSVVIALWVSIASVYAGVRDHEFLRYDDDTYVTENPELRHPLDGSALIRAFSTPYFANWIPLTTLSLHLDRVRAGEDPAAFLASNVVLHALGSAALFLALLRLGIPFGPSAFASGVFALHPLHVESVAWISARKDVLSGVCFGVALWCYARDARTPRPRLLGTALWLALGLLAKPTLVAVPLLLLVLDVWPLRRYDREHAAPLHLAAALREKWLLFGLAIAASYAAIVAQRGGGTLDHGDALPIGVRLANAALAVVAYLRDSFWPTRLAAFYPHPEGAVSWLAAGLAALSIAALCLLCVRLRHRQSGLALGWLWFLILLAPMLGFVQAGLQARADRYTYLALTGLALALALPLAAWAAPRPARRRACTALALLSLAACAVVSRRQVELWRDTETLFLHAAAVTEGNFLAEHSIGSELLRRGEPALAEPHFVAAVGLRERWADAHFGLADALVEQGRHAEAIRSYERGLRLAPRSARGQLRLARALLASGQDAEALGRARHAVALALPRERAFALCVLGAVLVERGALADAINAYERAIASQPDLAEAHAGLGIAQLAQGKPDLAYASLRQAEALGGGGPALWLTLGDAERELGRENDARLHFEAVRLEAERMQDPALAAEVARRLRD